jgi:hypothetical protein
MVIDREAVEGLRGLFERDVEQQSLRVMAGIGLFDRGKTTLWCLISMGWCVLRGNGGLPKMRRSITSGNGGVAMHLWHVSSYLAEYLKASPSNDLSEFLF